MRFSRYEDPDAAPLATLSLVGIGCVVASFVSWPLWAMFAPSGTGGMESLPAVLLASWVTGGLGGGILLARAVSGERPWKLLAAMIAGLALFLFLTYVLLYDFIGPR